MLLKQTLNNEGMLGPTHVSPSRILLKKKKSAINLCLKVHFWYLMSSSLNMLVTSNSMNHSFRLATHVLTENKKQVRYDVITEKYFSTACMKPPPCLTSSVFQMNVWFRKHWLGSVTAGMFLGEHFWGFWLPHLPSCSLLRRGGRNCSDCSDFSALWSKTRQS